jgi:hypothetical protein
MTFCGLKRAAYQKEMEWPPAFDLNSFIDYCLSSVTQLTRGIWMSFFYTEEAHAVMLAYVANGGGRAALKVTPTSLNL